jgi:REP element-mobilizing transposase RayT
MRNPSKGHAALRKGRWSAGDTMYFITICLRPEQSGFDRQELFEKSLTTLKTLEGESCKVIHGIVHMPDHIHMLIELNTETSLQELVRLYKGRMTPALRRHGLNWQSGFHDRRIRPDDSVGAVLRYMLMNPYRKGLLDTNDVWQPLYCTKEAETWISIAEEKNVPLPKWI